MEEQLGSQYSAKKRLFSRGLRTGRLTVREIDQELPPGSLTPEERWLLLYSLSAAGVDIVDEEEDPAAVRGAA